MYPRLRVGPRREPSRGRLLAAATLPALLALGACDVPTALPKWDTTWVAPGNTATVSVSSLLPSTIALGPGGTTFAATLQPASFSKTLGELCGDPCVLTNGQTVPKPAFTVTTSNTFSLPSELVSADLTGGQLQVQISHNFPFDPIRPSATARGYIVLTVSSGGVVIARDSIPGETTAFPTGAVLSRTLTPVSSTVSGPVTLDIKVSSPAGSPVRIDTSNRLTFTPQILLGAAQIRVTNRSISSSPTTLDLGSVDNTVTDHTQGGALLLDFDNPFSVSGPLTLTLTGSGVNLTKSLQLQAGATSARVPFSDSEIRSMLGAGTVQLSVAGTVSAPSGGTTVRPTQTVTIRSRVELTIGSKEG